MTRKVNLLDRARTASPCKVEWGDMCGNDRIRTCDKCSQYVYNLAGLTSVEVEQLLRGGAGKDCERVYRRHDFTVIAKDCPRGRRWARLTTMTIIASAGLALFAANRFGEAVRNPKTEYYDMSSIKPFNRWRPQIPLAPVAVAPPLPRTHGPPRSGMPGLPKLTAAQLEAQWRRSLEGSTSPPPLPVNFTSLPPEQQEAILSLRSKFHEYGASNPKIAPHVTIDEPDLPISQEPNRGDEAP